MYFYQSTQIRDDKRWRFRLFALPSSENLGKEMAYLLGTSLNLISVGSFADGESSIKIDEGVRGKEVYVVCR
jgi:phosphoribosylpyrophosphate synthetase